MDGLGSPNTTPRPAAPPAAPLPISSPFQLAALPAAASSDAELAVPAPPPAEVRRAGSVPATGDGAVRGGPKPAAAGCAPAGWPVPALPPKPWHIKWELSIVAGCSLAGGHSLHPLSHLQRPLALGPPRLLHRAARRALLFQGKWPRLPLSRWARLQWATAAVVM